MQLLPPSLLLLPTRVAAVVIAVATARISHLSDNARMPTPNDVTIQIVDIFGKRKHVQSRHLHRASRAAHQTTHGTPSQTRTNEAHATARKQKDLECSDRVKLQRSACSPCNRRPTSATIHRTCSARYARSSRTHADVQIGRKDVGKQPKLNVPQQLEGVDRRVRTHCGCRQRREQNGCFERGVRCRSYRTERPYDAAKQLHGRACTYELRV